MGCKEVTVRKIITAALCLAFSGCATTWYSDKFPTEESKQAQLKVDTGYCRSVSYGAVPMPPIRVYSPQQQSYTIQGSGTGYSNLSGRTNYSFTGTATPVPNAGASFVSGFAQGAAIGAALRASAHQEEVFNACMTQLGWSDTPIPTTSSANLKPDTTSAVGVSDASQKKYISCFPYKRFGEPDSGIDYQLLMAEYVVDTKGRTITDGTGEPITPYFWDGSHIALAEMTNETYDTKPPITRAWVTLLDLEKQTSHFSYAWLTSNGLALDSEQLKAVAGNHPLYLTPRGIEPPPRFAQIACTYRDNDFLK